MPVFGDPDCLLRIFHISFRLEIVRKLNLYEKRSSANVSSFWLCIYSCYQMHKKSPFHISFDCNTHTQKPINAHNLLQWKSDFNGKFIDKIHIWWHELGHFNTTTKCVIQFKRLFETWNQFCQSQNSCTSFPGRWKSVQIRFDSTNVHCCWIHSLAFPFHTEPKISSLNCKRYFNGDAYHNISQLK